MAFPLTFLTGWRFQQLMPPGAKMGFLESNRLILKASVLNMTLPSKMGDFAKAYFVKDSGYLSGTLSLSLVIFEKACDMLSLLLWCAFGLLLYPEKDLLFWIFTVLVLFGLVTGSLFLGYSKFAHLFFKVGQKITPHRFRSKLNQLQSSWEEMHFYLWDEKVKLIKVVINSIFIWFLHILQIWLFTLALNTSVPFMSNLAIAPLAILAGLLPLTFAGIGTRDGAIVLLYQPFLSKPFALALGLLCTVRYLLPAIVGLPFLVKYLVLTRGLRKAPSSIMNVNTETKN